MRAKIVCTLGPASSSAAEIERLARAGMAIARLNFSHGKFDEHLRRLHAVREVSVKLDQPIAVLQDLPGPKIRIGEVKDGRVTLRNKAPVLIAMCADEGTAERLTTDYAQLGEEMEAGERVLLADGTIELKVCAVRSDGVECVVVRGGTLTGRKGLNFPNAGRHSAAFTDTDKAAVRFGVAEGVDYIAMSFVRTGEDVAELRQFLQAMNAEVPIIAKLEKPQAISNLESILTASDAVMVARGDLGVEMSPAEVPLLQKHIIHQARQMRVPTIVATQMLESMTHSPRPTRAEASDVANAILDGADAVMLSEETAIGEYPVETVEMMSQIIAVAEREPGAPERRAVYHESIPQSVCIAACQTANQLNAKYLVAFTETGTTARLLSQARPRRPILAFTPHDAIHRRLNLYWGVTPRLLPQMASTDAMIDAVDRHLLQRRLVQRGDLLVLVCGAPIGTRDTTNLMKVHRAGAKDLG